MSQDFFDELGLRPPDFNLDVRGGSHGKQTGAMLAGIEDALLKTRPEAVLVLGDTNSTLAGALAAAKLGVPVGHVEAGLRSFDRRMPEEVNRVLADHASDALYCPHDQAAAQLDAEGIRQGVHVVGDLMVDAFNDARKRTPDPTDGDRAWIGEEPYWLLTLHRPSTVDDGRNLGVVLEAIAAAGHRFLWPVHPRTQNVLEGAGILGKLKDQGIHAVAPRSYLQMHALLMGAEGLATDSGGMQKEAYLAGIPCVTLRDTTEWTETIDAGWNVLVGHDPEAITEALMEFRPRGERDALWGSPGAAERIVDLLDELSP